MPNALNLHCPNCGDADRIDILVSLYVRLTEDGSDADLSHSGDHHWTGTSTYHCAACGTYGLVSALREGGGG